MKRAAVIAAVAATGVFLVLELALRILGYSAPQWYELDADLGWKPRAHRHGWFAAESGPIRVDLNSAGFRDREPRFLEKPGGVYRIAVLGDEYSEALQVPLERTWWWQLRAALGRCDAGRRVQVLNFAVGGYGTAQEYVLLQSTVMRYQPDLVLLQFSNRDDVIDNSVALARDKQRPFYVLDARGVARIDESFAASPAFQQRMQTRYRLGAEIADHSRAFQLARQLAGQAFIGEAHALADPAVLEPPRGRPWEDAWRVTEALLGRMHDFARRNGAKLVVVAAPHPLQAGRGIAYPDQRLQSFGRIDKLPVISLADALRADRFYVRSGEWSVAGHAAAAAEVAPQLCGLL